MSETAKPRRRYVPAIGPRLKKLLFVVFALFALLGANSLYLVGIRILGWSTEQSYENFFYLVMFLTHLGLGLLLVLPLVAFGIAHIFNSYNRPNRRAVRVGYGLFSTALILLASGFVLMRVEGLIDVRDPTFRAAAYWVHVIAPLVAIWLFVLHRLAGKRIKWKVGASWSAATAAVVFGMLLLQSQDPRAWNVVGNPKGDQYFFPSLARTVTGDFIPAETLMMDEYCKTCHEDIHASWSVSVHRFGSFNNPAYEFSVRGTRRAMFERDGNVQGARFCAGCHDPVPFFSGAFDDPKFDDPDYDLASDEMAQAGITCTACHAITNINSPRGNSDYTIEEPVHYPFAFSQNPLLQTVSQQLIKAKPEFHKKTFLKPLHKTTEFCGTCHKVHLPEELNGYKFLRGQNHYDAFLLSGVSGVGVTSFYYPPKAEENCNQCHMPLRESGDFGAQIRDESDEPKIHDHQFPSANTAIPHLLGMAREVIDAHREFNRGVMRVDLFGLKEGGRIDDPLTAPLRPAVPPLKPGTSYLFEAVIRTVKMGHIFTQGTSDSNEVWLDIEVRSGDRVLGRSGGMAAQGDVDPWSHFVNSFVLDRDGNRIDQRNAQDIFTALYNNQIPPGAAAAVHYRLDVPNDVVSPITVTAKLRFRKFDTTYMRFFQGEEFDGNDLPILELASDQITFPIAGSSTVPANPDSPIVPWQRWNDYGIGLLRKGALGELRQARQAFAKVEELGRPDGAVNLARVFIKEGLVQSEAPEALARAKEFDEPAAPAWTLLWLNGQVSKRNGDYDRAIADFKAIVEGGFEGAKGRGFDFSKDYRLLNQLAQAVYLRALQERGENRAAERAALMEESMTWYRRALEIDPENVNAHWGMKQIYEELGEVERAKHHEELHATYKPDDNARDSAIAKARQQYPAANVAAEAVVIYDLARSGAFELEERRNR